ncbi:KEOPS complex kinase/ATPase Bud32 [Nanoarchaeota archaeon]
MKELCRGAEAVISKDKDKIVKKRVPKGYRLKQLDDSIRSSRTRRESKVIEKLSQLGLPVPKLIQSDGKETIEMEFVSGERLADCLDKDNQKELMMRVGEIVAVIHNNGIVHGDLTTSNMISSEDVYFIDFGLSFFSEKIEDKAVDIHLLKQALDAKHYQIAEDSFQSFKKGYKKSKDFSKVLERLEKVEARGRYKGKSAQ